LIGIGLGGHPGLVLGVPPARVAVVDALPVEARLGRRAATAVIDAIAGSPDLPVFKAAAGDILAIGTALVTVALIAVVALLAPLLDTVATAVRQGCDDAAGLRVAGMRRTGVSVVGAHFGRTGSTRPLITRVAVSAGIAVTTGH
jgi:hypothetical protein